LKQAKNKYYLRREHLTEVDASEDLPVAEDENISASKMVENKPEALL